MHEYAVLVEPAEWRDALSLFAGHDIYHLPEYHMIAENAFHSRPLLFLYREGDLGAAIPLVMRDIEAAQGATRKDLTSVYGYPGALTNVAAESAGAERFRSGFQQAVRDFCDRESIVTLFTRTNPLIGSNWLFGDDFEVVRLGRTVGARLDLDPEQDAAGQSNEHKKHLKRLRGRGFECREDVDGRTLDTFMAIYEENMRRVSAADSYFFSRGYYEDLFRLLGEHVRLFYVACGEEVAAAAFIFLCNDNIQYHLSGTLDRYRSFSPGRLLFEGVKAWGRERGYAWFHLGGGVGAREDSLFHYKVGMCPTTHEFSVVKYVHDRPAYERLVRQRLEASPPVQDQSFFPLYRA